MFDQTCSICLNDLEPCNPITTLSCLHQFHFQCFSQFATHNNFTNSCPLCRNSVFFDPENFLNQRITFNDSFIDPGNFGGLNLSVINFIQEIQNAMVVPSLHRNHKRLADRFIRDKCRRCGKLKFSKEFSTTQKKYFLAIKKIPKCTNCTK